MALQQQFSDNQFGMSTSLLCTVPSLWSYFTTGLQQLQEASQALEEQIAELKLQRSRNFDSVMLQQQRLKYFTALREGKVKAKHASVEATETDIQAQMKQLQSLNSIIEYFLREHPEVRTTWCIVPLSPMPSLRCTSPLRRSAPTSMRSSTASRTTASLRCWMYDMNVWDSVEECSISIVVFIVLRLRHQTDA